MDFDLTLPSGRVRARRWGPPDAPLLLCVHGLSANVTVFDFLAGRLAGDRQLVAFDLRGCGRSDVTPPGSYGMAGHAEDVLAVADALGATEFDAAGWSMGALILMDVARRDPFRLRSVSLIDHAGAAQSRALAAVREWLGRLDIVADTVEQYVGQLRHTGLPDAFYRYELDRGADGRYRPLTSHLAALEDMDQPWPRDWSDYWRALTMPAVLVRATRPINDGLIVPDRTVAALRDVNPSVRVIDAPDSDHFTVMADPVTVAAVSAVLADRPEREP
ncbi:MAG TPA: alpha/beta fold hydrolase [Mycobacterium sp.]|nr:alpha/beta fold hydrolase [Mycobacterium sp.]